jgi:hypothetical protein
MIFVVAVAGKEDDKVSTNFIDEAVLPDNPARPYYPRMITLKLLGIPYPFARRLFYF